MEEPAAHPTPEGDPPPCAQRRRHPVRNSFIVLASLLVLAVAAVGGYAWYLNDKVDHNVKREALLPGQSASSTPGSSGSSSASGTNVLGDTAEIRMNAKGQLVDGQDKPYVDELGNPIPVPVEIQQAFAKQGPGVITLPSKRLAQPSRAATQHDSLNYLVIGSDRRGSERGRSDVMVLVHVSSDRKRVDLFHFPRDLWTNISGIGHAKLNAAYGFGGTKKLIDTIQPMVGVPIDHVALVDFQGFQKMTDAIGGVDVQVREASPGYPVGTMHMNGQQGLDFVRDRHDLAQGDMGRGQRQMDFIKAVLMKALQPSVLLNPSEFGAFLDAATTSLTVDQTFTTSAMRDVAFSLRNMSSSDIHTGTIPWSGVGMENRQSIVRPAPEQLAKLAEALRTDSLAGYVDNVSPKTGFGPTS